VVKPELSQKIFWIEDILKSLNLKEYKSLRQVQLENCRTVVREPSTAPGLTRAMSSALRFNVIVERDRHR